MTGVWLRVRSLVPAVAFCFALTGNAVMPAAATPATMSHAAMSHGRYAGAPDLSLTSAMLAAGGGSASFRSTTLLGMLAAQHRDVEIARLQHRFGNERTARFFRTFDAFIADAVRVATIEHVALPAAQPALAHGSSLLGAALRRDGKMPDGRFDVGYLIEHLLSRPIHRQLMHDIDADPAVGPEANADFHLILTSALNDLPRIATSRS